ncbi:MAG: hypothetical protein OEO20_14035 [Gemmatimonadota bacterium]|nr:hypothetical protein [Gemmatimonadota bacterium]MDH3368823.1 hypothetical protein [Gemmatimonadota bacterium]MDH3479412.1 hypothetical protein [Gemmatimonadota bacterium]MDH3569663.1 hypothetical protein [Gemmatimonadota bacterium]MDH5551142.1 hypothetical protein [Gemmatimonadota bacterium]
MTHEPTTSTSRRDAATFAVRLGALAALAGGAILLYAIVFGRAEGDAMLGGAGGLLLLVGVALADLGLALRPHTVSPVTGVAPSTGAAAYFIHLWAGEIPLVNTFWLRGVSMNIVLLLTHLLTAGTALLIVYAAYWCALSVPIWRSSARYRGPRIWSFLARVSVVLGLLRMAVSGSCTASSRRGQGIVRRSPANRPLHVPARGRACARPSGPVLSSTRACRT